MSFSINTNVTSLQAQNYLRSSSDFQSKTINRVTSGLRIVNSGDDAAGLAIANGMRSDQAVLTQGIRNANDALSTLQTIDGGMNNISLLLDRARTLATQSASGTFSGSRDVLNNEFQNVLTEIDRQSTAIGMNTGGAFAKSMSVFIGGGRDASGDSSKIISNGSVGIDLSNSTVDTQSLGMKGYTAGWQVAKGADDKGLYDLSSGNTTTGVAALQAAASGVTAGTGKSIIKYDISGAGFSGTNGHVTISVNLANVTDSASLVSAINSGIQAAAATSNSAFKAANIVAQIHTGSDGHQQLQFASANTAFQITAETATNTAAQQGLANAFMGNITGNTNGDDNTSSSIGKTVSAATDSFTTNGTQQIHAAYVTPGTSAGETQTVSISIPDSTGAAKTVSATFNIAAATDTAALAADAINAAIQAKDDPSLKSIVAVADTGGAGITFASTSSSNFTVSFGVQSKGSATGFNADKSTIATSDVKGTGGTADISNQTSAGAAVSALSNAVTALGNAQANVGKGENEFSYAMNLAQSQSTNLAAAESRIRDADLATEAANLTKAQILVQAGTAALAQANSAPQSILSLLKS